MSRCLVLLALIFATNIAGAQEPPDEPKADAPAPNLHPEPPKPVPSDELASAIQRGVSFLLKDQSEDGSWGSPERTKNLNIMAGIGSHQAFRTAVTSLCVSALTEVDDGSESVAHCH